MKNERIHLSHNDKLEKRTYRQPQWQHHFKPLGIWYAIDDTWLDWSSENSSTNYHYRYSLELDMSEMLVLSSERPEELLIFLDDYGVQDDFGKKVKMVDWREVAKDYKGVEINPYDSSIFTRLDDLLVCLWYHAWDVPGGCIWDMGVIKNYGKSLLTNPSK